MSKLPRALVIAIVAAGSPARASPCPTMVPYSYALTPTGAALPDGGGVVVVTEATADPSAAIHGTASGWTLDNAVPTTIPLAPGLSLIPVGASGGTLADAHHAVVVTVAHAAGPAAPLAPPKIKRVHRDVHPGRHGWTDVTAELGVAPPRGAVALVLFDRTGKVARSWGPVSDGATAIVAYAPTSCAASPEGLTESAAGERVRFAWVDALGRTSAQSAPIAVVPGPPPAP